MEDLIIIGAGPIGLYAATLAGLHNLKGKIIDTVQKGYSINDKVLRHAKVVVGQ